MGSCNQNVITSDLADCKDLKISYNDARDQPLPPP